MAVSLNNFGWEVKMNDASNKLITSAVPPEILDQAIFIENFDGKTIQLEIAVLTATQVRSDRADVIRQFVVDLNKGEIEQLTAVLLAFVRAPTLAVWVDVGFYADDKRDNPKA
jgi:hypothetical protein